VARKTTPGEVDQRFEAIELRRRRAEEQGLAFAAPARDELATRLTDGGLFVESTSWINATGPNTRVWFEITVGSAAQPQVGSTLYSDFFVSLFFGTTGFFESGEHAYLARDRRFPILGEPVEVPSGGSATRRFTYNVPDGVRESTYFGNYVLWYLDVLGQGTSYARGCFDLTVY
jgi:hypothetical protein